MTQFPATRFLTYPGDVSKHIIGEVKGPNLFNEHVTAVSADYDSETNTTRVGFAYGSIDPTALAAHHNYLALIGAT